MGRRKTSGFTQAEEQITCRRIEDDAVCTVCGGDTIETGCPIAARQIGGLQQSALVIIGPGDNDAVATMAD